MKFPMQSVAIPVVRPSLRARGGFTLIELIIVTTIIALLTGIGVASYNNFNQKNIDRSAAKELMNNLRLAQTNARLGRKDPSCTAPLSGWQVVFPAGNTSYQIEGVCGATTFGLKTFSLPTGVTIAGSNFMFVALSGKTDQANDLTITVTGIGLTLPMRVTKDGEISLI